jgi:hypothetical protein
LEQILLLVSPQNFVGVLLHRLLQCMLIH